MKREVFRKSPLQILIAALVPMLFSIAVIGIITYGISQTELSNRDEGLRILEQGLIRATVTCYAVEGRYPDTLEYIKEHYGVYVDNTKYAVHYDIFASNIFPDITVLER